MNNQMLVSRKSRLIVDWTPRAACSMVVSMFFQHEGLLGEALKVRGDVHAYREVYYAEYGRVSGELLKDPSMVKVKFVRDPYARAVSCYEFLPCDTPLGNLSFKGFLHGLIRETVNLEGIYAYHCRRQALRGDDLMDHIVKVEDIPARLASVNALLGIRFESVQSVACVAVQRHQRHRWPRFAGDIPRKKLPAFKSGTPHPKYQDYYDAESKGLVEEAFRKDIEAFKYPFTIGYRG